MNELETFQTEILILLLGHNPVPNIVAGQLLVSLHENRTSIIYLLYSDKTARQKDTLKLILENFYQGKRVKVAACQLDASNPASIHRAMHQVLKGQEHRSIGLNYTGGTKTMAVHSYLAITQWAEKYHANVVKSYLSPQKNVMIFDADEPSQVSTEVAITQMPQVRLMLTDMLNLHNVNLKETGLPQTKNPLPITTEFLRKSHKKVLFGNQWKQEGSNNLKALLDPNNTQFNRLRLALCQDLHCNPQTLNTVLSKECRTFLKSGAWLEAEVFSILERNKVRLGLNDIAWNVKIEFKDEAQQSDENEVDVIAIKGHQLFGFSCDSGNFYDSHRKRISSKTSDLKLKLLEAHTRFSQMGGEEARVALICRHASPADVEISRARRFNDLKNKIKVFGQENFFTLEQDIIAWIEQES